jgi:hypothetical protein
MYANGVVIVCVCVCRSTYERALRERGHYAQNTKEEVLVSIYKYHLEKGLRKVFMFYRLFFMLHVERGH